MTKYLIGADPELFVQNKQGEFRSAHTFLPGTKDNPMPALNGAIQVDGVAAEFNIDPASTAEQFHEHIRDVLLDLQGRVDEKGLTLVVQPTATFDKKYFKRLPASVRALGCQPDFTVYQDGAANPPPATREPFRTGAGHLHIGWTEGVTPSDPAHLFDCHETIKQLDAVLYFTSLLWDSDTRRRELYGKMGSFRPKHYGVEYRPLSNAWVADPDLHIWIFNATQKSLHRLDDGVKIYNDYISRAMIADAQNDKEFSRVRLLEYHDYLVDHHGIPPLPESYSRTYQ